jgi:hypothetical protein
MWLQIAALETRQEERRDDKRRNAMAFVLDPSRPRDRRRFLDGE